MPAYDELRNELDELRSERLTVNESFQKLVEKYNKHAQKIEQLIYLQEQLEREGHKVSWPDFMK